MVDLHGGAMCFGRTTTNMTRVISASTSDCSLVILSRFSSRHDYSWRRGRRFAGCRPQPQQIALPKCYYGEGLRSADGVIPQNVSSPFFAQSKVNPFP